MHIINNWPTMWAALTHIITHPEDHDQTTWRNECGTTRCVAGWIAYMAGYRDVDPAHDDGATRLHLVNPPVGEETDVEEAALTVLGVDHSYLEYVSSMLFNGDLSLTDILVSVRILARSDGVTPPQVVIDKMLSIGVINEWAVSV